jgi:hypothetical protein
MLPAGIMATALFALLAFAPFASAAPDPLASGSTTITLDGKFTNYLKTFGITVQKDGVTKLKGKNATFTVTGGSLDPLTGLGEVTLGGGLKFKAGKKTAPVKGLVLNTTKKSLTGKVAGKQMKVASVAGWSFTRNGFGTNLTVKKLKLTGSAASALNKKTGYAKGKPKPFLGNKLIGKGTSTTQPSTVVVLPGGNANLALSPVAAEKLAKVGPTFEVGPGVFANPFAVKLAPVAPTVQSGLNLAFPISGGTMGPLGTSGTLQTAGGLTLKQNLEAGGPNGAGETTLTMGNIFVDMATKQATVEVTIANPKTAAANLGNLGRASIADLVIGSVVADPATRTVTVTNASATLQAVTAETLNSVFVKPIEDATKQKDDVQFAAGDPLGLFSFTAQTQ